MSDEFISISHFVPLGHFDHDADAAGALEAAIENKRQDYERAANIRLHPDGEVVTYIAENNGVALLRGHKSFVMA